MFYTPSPQLSEGPCCYYDLDFVVRIVFTHFALDGDALPPGLYYFKIPIAFSELDSVMVSPSLGLG